MIVYWNVYRGEQMRVKVRVSRSVWVMMAGVAVLGVGTAWRSELLLTEIWGKVWPWLVVAAAAGLHELGHLVAAWGVGVKIDALRIGLMGARLEMRGLPSYAQEMAVAAGGPFVNGVSAALAYPFLAVRGSEDWLGLFFGASVILGVINLLPIRTLDGGRMLGSFAAWAWGDRVSATLIQVSTGLCIGAFWMLSAYALLRVGNMLSAFVFSLCLLLRVSSEAPDIS